MTEPLDHVRYAAIKAVAAIDGDRKVQMLCDEIDRLRLLVDQAKPIMFPKGKQWKPGEKVALVQGGYGGNPRTLTHGVVTEVKEGLQWYDELWVHLEGEEEPRGINPDVMTHVKWRQHVYDDLQNCVACGRAHVGPESAKYATPCPGPRS